MKGKGNFTSHKQIRSLVRRQVIVITANFARDC